MATTFDKNNKLILVTSVLEVTIQQLLNAIRRFEDEQYNMEVRKICNASGKKSIGGGVYVGITLELVNDWRVEFEAEVSQTFKFIRGGNLIATNIYSNNPIKATTNVNVIVELSTSASLLEGSGSPWTQQQVDDIIQDVSDIEDDVGTIDVNVLDILSDTGFLVDEAGGKWAIVGNEMIFYKADNITEIMRFTISRDGDGNPTMRTRQP